MITRTILLLINGILLCISLSACSYARNGYQSALGLVKNQPCAGGLTVDRYMDRKLNLGYGGPHWHTFANGRGYDVERSVKVSKFAEKRYRWRVGHSGQITPSNRRANRLCSQ